MGILGLLIEILHSLIIAFSKPWKEFLIGRGGRDIGVWVFRRVLNVFKCMDMPIKNHLNIVFLEKRKDLLD